MLVLLGFVRRRSSSSGQRSSHFRIEEQPPRPRAEALSRSRAWSRSSRDPDIMRWAIKLMGNGGLGAIRGSFWSKRIGKFLRVSDRAPTTRLSCAGPTGSSPSRPRTRNSSCYSARVGGRPQMTRPHPASRGWPTSARHSCCEPTPCSGRSVEKWAADELRSVNGQIEFILREAVRRRNGARASGGLPPGSLPPASRQLGPSDTRLRRRPLRGIFGERTTSRPPTSETPSEAQERIAALRAEVALHDERYYRQARPEITDLEYDRIKRELGDLEARFPGACRGRTRPPPGSGTTGQRASIRTATARRCRASTTRTPRRS